MFSLGKFIKSKRTECNITMEELATKIGTSQSALSLIENDKRMPTIETLNKISNALNLPDKQYNELISRRQEVLNFNRKLRNEIVHGKIFINNDISSIYNSNDISNKYIRISFLKDYITEISIRTTTNGSIDPLISSFIENAICNLIENEFDNLTNSIKGQILDCIDNSEKMLYLLKNSNTID